MDMGAGEQGTILLSRSDISMGRTQKEKCLKKYTLTLSQAEVDLKPTIGEI